MSRSALPEGVTVRHEILPGDIGSLVSLHGTLYAREYGWDHSFEAYVAAPLAEFAVSRSDRERIWIVEREGVVAGSIAIVGSSADTAQLRWFLLHPSVRGRGLGKHLLDEAIGFCRDEHYRTVFLWTVKDLAAAAHLYLASGFHLTLERTHQLWGKTVTEQRYETLLG